MPQELLIDGSRFCDYEGFVEEFNRAYMAAFGASPPDANAPWDGEISDLHDLIETTGEGGGERLTIRWIHSRKSASELGHGEMAEFWRRSVARIPAAVFSPDAYQLVYGWNQERLDQAEAGRGRTLFEYLVWQMSGDGDDLVDLKLEW
jgi:hypothetical protein